MNSPINLSKPNVIAKSYTKTISAANACIPSRYQSPYNAPLKPGSIYCVTAGSAKTPVNSLFQFLITSPYFCLFLITFLNDYDFYFLSVKLL